MESPCEEGGGIDPDGSPCGEGGATDPDGRLDEVSAFRATVLLHFHHTPEGLEAARRLGFSFTRLWLAVEKHLGQEHAAATRDELRAASADLRVLQSFLFQVGREHLDRDLNPADRHLSRLASKLATRVGGIAATIEEALQAAGSP